MNKEDKLILGTLAGVDLVLSPEHYEEYKGTLNKQLEQKDKEIERLNNIIDELENIRKETIEYITTEQLYTNYQWGKSQYVKILKDLLNILNKGDNNE